MIIALLLIWEPVLSIACVY